MLRPRTRLLVLAIVCLVAVATCLLLVTAKSCSSALPDIYLVVIDTGRQDHFSLHGHHLPTSPALTSLVQEREPRENSRRQDRGTGHEEPPMRRAMPEQGGMGDYPDARVMAVWKMASGMG